MKTERRPLLRSRRYKLVSGDAQVTKARDPRVHVVYSPTLETGEPYLWIGDDAMPGAYCFGVIAKYSTLKALAQELNDAIQDYETRKRPAQFGRYRQDRRAKLHHRRITR